MYTNAFGRGESIPASVECDSLTPCLLSTVRIILKRVLPDEEIRRDVAAELIRDVESIVSRNVAALKQNPQFSSLVIGGAFDRMEQRAKEEVLGYARYVFSLSDSEESPQLKVSQD
jgi:hypothetical protein